ncbi:MAG: hypothetical protein AABW73_01585 [Nanoarchaeota archaeon]
MVFGFLKKAVQSVAKATGVIKDTPKVELRVVSDVEKVKNRLHNNATNDFERKIANIASRIHDGVSIDKISSQITNVLYNHDNKISSDFSQKLMNFLGNNNSSLRNHLEAYTIRPALNALPVNNNVFLMSDYSKRMTGIAASVVMAAGSVMGLSTSGCVSSNNSCDRNDRSCISSVVADDDSKPSRLDEVIDNLNSLHYNPVFVRDKVTLPKPVNNIVMNGDKVFVIPPRPTDSMDVPSYVSLSKTDLDTRMLRNTLDHYSSLGKDVSSAYNTDDVKKALALNNDDFYTKPVSPIVTVLDDSKVSGMIPAAVTVPTMDFHNSSDVKDLRFVLVDNSKSLESSVKADWEVDVSYWSDEESSRALSALDKIYSANVTPDSDPDFSFVKSLEKKYSGIGQVAELHNYLVSQDNERKADVALAKKMADETVRVKKYASDNGLEFLTSDDLFKNQAVRTDVPLPAPTADLRVMPGAPLPPPVQSIDLKVRTDVPLPAPVPSIDLRVRTDVPLPAPTTDYSYNSGFVDWHVEIDGKSKLYQGFIQRTIHRGQSETFDKFPESLSTYHELTADYGVSGVEAMGAYLDKTLGRNDLTIGLEKQVLGGSIMSGAPLPSPISSK